MPWVLPISGFSYFSMPYVAVSTSITLLKHLSISVSAGTVCSFKNPCTSCTRQFFLRLWAIEEEEEEEEKEEELKIKKIGATQPRGASVIILELRSVREPVPCHTVRQYHHFPFEPRKWNDESQSKHASVLQCGT